MGRIPESFIDELIARLDIVEVVAARIPLKPAGREFQALCPFHDENSPSFTVSPQKQFYHCFGCGVHGNAIGFAMEYDRLSFLDAVEELAKAAGLQVPTEARQRDDDSEPLYSALAAAEIWYRQQLKAHPQAVQYLKSRGISGDIAHTYRIGFAPPGWDGLVRALGGNGQRVHAMDRAGLLSQRSGGGHYDKFRDRIMFPIHDSRGRTVAFGGRVIPGPEPNVTDSPALAVADARTPPKYLNSPETPLFHKGRQLYGLFQARQRSGRLQRLLVVEGYMDVVALAQFGLPETVATLGTATTPEHAETLFRAAGEAVFCFDGDRAGRQAAIRAMEAVLPRLREGRQARFLFLPEGEDPDSLIRNEGLQDFSARVSNATPLSDVLFAHYQAQVDMSSLDGRARLVELVRPQLQIIPQGPFRDMMMERLEERARTRIKPAVATLRRRHTNQQAAAQPSLVRQAIALLLQRPELALAVRDADALSALHRPGIELLRELLAWVTANPQAKTAHILAHWQGRAEEKHLVKLATQPLLSDDDQIEKEFHNALHCLRRDAVAERESRLRAKLDHAGIQALSDEEKDELRRLQRNKEGASDEKSL